MANFDFIKKIKKRSRDMPLLNIFRKKAITFDEK